MGVGPLCVKASRGSRFVAPDQFRGPRSQVVAVSQRSASILSVAASEKPTSPSSPFVTRAADAPRIDELVREHSEYVAGLAYRLLGRDSEVDDVVQDVFVALLRFHDSVREPNALRAWLGTTTVRLAQRRLRARSFRLRSLLGLDQPEPNVLYTRGAGAEEHLALARVHRALDGVAAGARIAWVLRYVEQERMEDVARLCGCSLTTAKRRVEAAQVAVKRALGDG